LTWRAYRESGGDLMRPDWRRRNVDLFVERAYREVRDIKPWVKFGVSPFGIWRPGYPDGITGFDAYNGIYADARKWLTSGWVDYLSPQLYWAMDSPGQSYARLLAWWVDQNEMGRHIWPGNFTSRITLEGERYWDAPELVRQIRHTQSTFGADGNIHFSMQALMPSRHGMGEALRDGVYREPALVPASPWLGGAPPPRPIVRLSDSSNGIEAHFLPGDEAEVWIWAIRSFVDGRWITEFVPGRRRSLLLPTGYGGRMPEAVAVSAVERTGLEGEVAVVRLAAANLTRRAW
jgi:hypothetical protein